MERLVRKKVTRYDHLRDLNFRSRHRVELQNENNQYFDWPLFLTYKYKLTPLQQMMQIRADQLQDHFLNNKDLFVWKCKCANTTHSHDKKKCRITSLSECARCNKPTELLVKRDEYDFMV